MRLLRIFVVEDHADTLRWIRYYFEDQGHHVSSAICVDEALAKLKVEEIDVLLCDIGLPDGNGWELLTKAALSKSVFAIAMSGFGMNADSGKSLSTGFRHHLLKPFKTAELDKLLNEVQAAA